RADAAFSQAWPAFALGAGLLLVGSAAARDGVFEAAGALSARAPGGPVALLAALLLVEAAVTAVLNLDTAVVFMTPVLLHAARRRGVADDAFLYGAVFMANAASLLLPGSNLTNLIVLAHEHVAGTALLLGILGIAVALGALARAADVADLVEHAGRWETAWLAVGAAALVNNLPAAVMLSSRVPAHPRALLLGLDLGPNLVATGSLS